MDLRIIQQNICKDNKQVKELMDILLSRNPHILMFSEFCYSNCKMKIVERLKEKDYKIIMPFEFIDSDDGDRNKPCVCMIAIKDEINFVPRLREGISLNLRYIEGRIELGDGKNIEIFFTHVPQTCIARKTSQFTRENVEYYQDRVEYRASLI